MAHEYGHTYVKCCIKWDSPEEKCDGNVACLVNGVACVS